IDVSGFPVGLTAQVNYLPTIVQVQVVAAALHTADFDHDGDVDTTDYLIWKGAFGLNALGDANGDGKSDSADYTIWRDQLTTSQGGAGADGSKQDLHGPPDPATLYLAFRGLPAACGRAFRRTTPANRRWPDCLAVKTAPTLRPGSSRQT